MSYAMSNEGTKIPKAFKKDKAVKKAVSTKGRMQYMKEIASKAPSKLKKGSKI